MSNEKSTVSFSKKYGLLFADLAMLVIFLLPTPTDLTTTGHRMLGILIFAIIFWITEAVSYPVSAAIIATLMFLCLGMNPNPQDPAKLLGTSKAVGMSFGSITSNRAALVGAALFLAAAMMYTGLDRRIALFILSKVGAKTNRILAGMIFVGFILAFFVPSTTARVGCIVPIVLGISMGSALLSTKAAAWLANQLMDVFELISLSVFTVFAILALFLIVVHLGFASATAVASSMIPIMIAVLQVLGNDALTTNCITMVLQVVVSFGFILPVNSPQGILAFSTETFSAKDCIKVGLPLTIIGYLMMLFFAQTYWHMLGIF